MRMRGRRGGLSLRGWAIGNGGGRMNLSGRCSQFSGATYSATKEWLDFKLYIIDNFLQPINKLNYDLVRKNFYNFDIILARLDGFKNETNKEEVELFKKMVSLMRYSTEKHISFEEAQEKLFGGEEMMQLRVITSRIILQAPFEIYNLLFGRPDKKKSIDHQRYEDHLILEIKKILAENPGILFDDIKKKMGKYAYKFIDASGCEVGCGEWVCDKPGATKDFYPRPTPVDKSHIPGPSNKGARQGCACPKSGDVGGGKFGKFTPHGNLAQPCKTCGC